MDIIRTARRAFSTVRSHKYLLFFGFFVASGGGVGGNLAGHGHHAGGPLPAWVLPLVGAALALGVVGLVMNLLSEAALIDGVERAQHGESSRIGDELGASKRYFWTIAGIKLVLGGAFLLTLGVVFAPLLGGLLGAYPKLAGAVGTALFVLPAVPWLLTLYFVYMYALRIAVLDGTKAMDSIRAAKRYLHGRIASSLSLLVAGGLGAVALELCGVLVALPIAALGLGIYFMAGLVPALVVGGVLFAPVAVVIAGSVGAYRSSVWTIGFLEERGAI